MNYISDILYWISTGLLVPVIVLLIILFVRSLLLIGSFFGQYLSYSMTEMFSQEDFTMVKNPGKENMEIITKEGEKINRYTPSEDTSSQSGKKGKKVGIAYELENGEIIYVPEE